MITSKSYYYRYYSLFFWPSFSESLQVRLGLPKKTVFENHQGRIFHITGCVVAQHCYNGDVSVLWEKMETLTSCKIETLEQIAHNLSGLITSRRGVFAPNLVKIRSPGTSGQRGFCVTFLFIYFFSDQRREETPGRILTRNGSKDAEGCAFLGL